MSVDTQRWDGILSASAGGRIDGSNAVASENSLKVAGVDTVIPFTHPGAKRFPPSTRDARVRGPAQHRAPCRTSTAMPRAAGSVREPARGAIKQTIDHEDNA